jgi:hypothetical protein
MWFVLLSLSIVLSQLVNIEKPPGFSAWMQNGRPEALLLIPFRSTGHIGLLPVAFSLTKV